MSKRFELVEEFPKQIWNETHKEALLQYYEEVCIELGEVSIDELPYLEHMDIIRDSFCVEFGVRVDTKYLFHKLMSIRKARKLGTRSQRKARRKRREE